MSLREEKRARAAATLLATVLVAPGLEADLAALLTSSPDPEELERKLRALAGLPPAVPRLARTALLVKMKHERARRIAEMAGTGMGRVVISDLGHGWQGLALVDQPERGLEFTEFFGQCLHSEDVMRRRAPMLILQ